MNDFYSYGKKFLKAFTGLALAGWVWVCPLGADTPAPDQEKVEIQVAETSLVPGSEIFLGDIAQIHASPFLKEVLMKIGLGNAPKPGQIKQLSKNRILSLIRSCQGLPGDMEIQAPEIVYVKRTSQQITEQEIRNQIEIFLADFFNGKEYEIEHVNIKDPGPYPQGELTFSSASKSQVDKQGNFTVFLDILVNGIREESLRIPGKVAVYEDIQFAARNMTQGDEVLEEYLYSVRKNIFSLPEDAVRIFQAGKILKTAIPKDSPLRASWLKETPLISKGDIVTLVARSNNLVIVTTGISQEDGYAQELIRVENLGSGKIVKGQVLEKSTVEVIY